MLCALRVAETVWGEPLKSHHKIHSNSLACIFHNHIHRMRMRASIAHTIRLDGRVLRRNGCGTEGSDWLCCQQEEAEVKTYIERERVKLLNEVTPFQSQTRIKSLIVDGTATKRR